MVTWSISTLHRALPRYPNGKPQKICYRIKHGYVHTLDVSFMAQAALQVASAVSQLIPEAKVWEPQKLRGKGDMWMLSPLVAPLPVVLLVSHLFQLAVLIRNWCAPRIRLSITICSEHHTCAIVQHAAGVIGCQSKPLMHPPFFPLHPSSGFGVEPHWCEWVFIYFRWFTQGKANWQR